MTDSFDSFVNLDWLGADNDSPATATTTTGTTPSPNPDPDLDLDTMSSSDLFKYFLDSEMAKDLNSTPHDHHLTYPQLANDSTTNLPLMPSLVSPSALMSTQTTITSQILAQRTSTFSLPNSPASSHHPDDDLAMAEVKTEPVPLSTAEMLRVLNTTSQQQATPAQKPASPTKMQRAGSEDSEDEPMLPTDAADLKKMTSKERRQLRNKISARNFRVRRKEYISTLEAQVQHHQDEAQQLREQMQQLEEENRQLREELDLFRSQPAPDAKQQTPRSPISTPTLNKDIGISGARATDTYRPDQARVLVSNAVMPEWNLEAILARDTRVPDTHVAKVEKWKPLAVAPELRRNWDQDQSVADLILAMDHPREAALAASIVTCLAQRMAASVAESIVAMPVQDAVRWLYPAAAEPDKYEWDDAPLKPDDLLFDLKPAQDDDFAIEAFRPLSLSVPVREVETAPSAAYIEWLYDAVIMAALSSAVPAAGAAGVAGVTEGDASASNLDRLAAFFWWDGASSV